MNETHVYDVIRIYDGELRIKHLRTFFPNNTDKEILDGISLYLRRNEHVTTPRYKRINTTV